MPHITLPEGAPGILGPMQAYPETQRHLSALAEALLRGPSSLTSAERETIAASVSYGNECVFCSQSRSRNRSLSRRTASAARRKPGSGP